MTNVSALFEKKPPLKKGNKTTLKHSFKSRKLLKWGNKMHDSSIVLSWKTTFLLFILRNEQWESINSDLKLSQSFKIILMKIVKQSTDFLKNLFTYDSRSQQSRFVSTSVHFEFCDIVVSRFFPRYYAIRFRFQKFIMIRFHKIFVVFPSFPSLWFSIVWFVKLNFRQIFVLFWNTSDWCRKLN